MMSSSQNETYAIVKQILERRFPDIPKKQEIQKTSKGLKIACPYCGDSNIDPSKKRGNVYLTSNSYKCWNDGCFKFKPLGKFLADFALEYNLDLSEIDLEFDSNWDKSKITYQEKSINPILDYLKDTGDYDKLLDVNYFISILGLQPMYTISEMATDIVEFINKRKLSWGNHYNQIVYYDGSYDKIWLLNIHIPTGKVLGLSNRSVLKKQFKIYTYLTLKEDMGIEIEFEDFESVVTLGSYFNILNVDFSKPVALTEAQIDGMFINNCISIQGVNKTAFLFEYFKKKTFNLMFDYDVAGMTETLKDSQDGHGFLMWSKMQYDLRKMYMKDVRKILKIKDINDLFIFVNDKFEVGINDFQLFLSKYLTNDKHDLFYL